MATATAAFVRRPELLRSTIVLRHRRRHRRRLGALHLKRALSRDSRQLGGVLGGLLLLLLPHQGLLEEHLLGLLRLDVDRVERRRRAALLLLPLLLLGDVFLDGAQV